MFGLDKTLSAIVACLVAAAVLAVLVFGGLYLSERRKAQEARAGESVAQGRTTSAVEAIKEIGELGERSNATDEQVRQAQEAVRNAAPEDRQRTFAYNACVLQHRTDCDGLLGTR